MPIPHLHHNMLDLLYIQLGFRGLIGHVCDPALLQAVEARPLSSHFSQFFSWKYVVKQMIVN